MKKILIVDDDITILTLLKFRLGKLEFDVTACQHGIEAQEVLKSDKSFDIILSDIRMPDCDGIELLSFVKSSPDLDMPMALMTGYSEYSSTEASTLGAAFFIHKPFDFNKLISEINRVS